MTIRISLRGLVVWGILTLLLLPRPAGASEANELKTVTEVVTRYLCYEVYWAGKSYRRGIPLSLEVKIDGDRFSAWVHEVMVEPRVRASVFLMGSLRKGKVGVGLRRGYNEYLAPRFPTYTKDRSHFSQGPVSRTAVTIPEDCTPHYDPVTPEKDRMLSTIVTTVQRFLSSLVRAGIWVGNRNVTLTIAAFDVDYPHTYILVEPPGDLYTVALHDPQDYSNDEYECSGEYPIGEVLAESERQDLLPKIRKHGVTRQVVISP